MLRWALFFLAIALATVVAATIGLDGATMGLAKAVCFAALVLFVVFVGVGASFRRV